VSCIFFVCLPVLSLSLRTNQIFIENVNTVRYLYLRSFILPETKRKDREDFLGVIIDWLSCFLETKGHVGVSESNLACLIYLEGFWWPILAKSLLWLSLTGFWWPYCPTWSWKRIVALEILSRRVLVTVLLKELDIEPILLELVKLLLFHCSRIFREKIQYSAKNSKQNIFIRTWPIESNYLLIIHCSWKLYLLTVIKGTIIRGKLRNNLLGVWFILPHKRKTLHEICVLFYNYQAVKSFLLTKNSQTLQLSPDLLIWLEAWHLRNLLDWFWIYYAWRVWFCPLFI